MDTKKVLVGMSGGVDSTVSAMLLQQDGYHVEGVYMRLHNRPGYHEVHQKRAQKAADFLGVKLHILDLEKRFDEKVFTPFIESYKSGNTPNPCALCNKNIKFGALVEFADSIDADFIATGHYIRHDGTYLITAEDETKDQSYFLFAIDKKIVPRLLFPMGEHKKTDIKALAASIAGLESFAVQSESSEICFVETDYTDILKQYIDVDMPGEVFDVAGNVIGEHKGYMHYTIGKRKGFTVNGAHDPHFVLDIDAKNNRITVGKREELACSRVMLQGVNMFDGRLDFDALVRLRYRTVAVACSVHIDDNEAVVTLKEPVFGVAAGQAAVFYDNEGHLLGGGWIVQALRA
jgi:tRNA-uridine 2-sulfurtransferase